jgi:hypothetical protein
MALIILSSMSCGEDEPAPAFEELIKGVTIVWDGTNPNLEHIPLGDGACILHHGERCLYALLRARHSLCRWQVSNSVLRRADSAVGGVQAG